MNYLKPVIAMAAVLLAVILAVTLPRADPLPQSVTSSQGTLASSTQTDSPTLSATVVQEHATSDDCWTIIEGNVYDITPYVPYHPGGLAEISKACGVDATALFTTRQGRVHSNSAHKIIENYFVGPLDGVISNTLNKTSADLPQNYEYESEEEYEEENEYEEEED